MLAVGRGEDDDRRAPIVERGQYFEAIELGELNVEKEQVGLELPDHEDGGRAAGGFADDGDIRHSGEQAPQAAPGEPFIVHDERADRRHVLDPAAAPRNGSSMRTSTPPSGCSRISNV